MQNTVGRFQQIPFAAAAIALAAGIGAAKFVASYSFPTLAAAAGLLIWAAALGLVRRQHRTTLAACLAGVAAAGLLLGLAERDAPPDNSVAALISRNRLALGEVAEFDGCILEESREQGEDTVALVGLRGLKLSGAWSPCRGRMNLRFARRTGAEGGEPAAPPLQYGDRIRGWARLDVPRNFENPGAVDFAGMLRSRGIQLLGRARSPRLLETLPQDCGSRWGKAASALRMQVRSHLQAPGIGQREASILSCILLGDDASLDPQTPEAFQNAGTYHVLVVSGLHAAWIAWLLLLGFRLLGLPAWASGLSATGAVLFYAQVVGFQAGITRCLYMLSFLLLGRSFCRSSPPVNIVFASGFCLLTLRPGWLFDVGFQLSFVSVLAITAAAAPFGATWLRLMWEPLRQAGRPDRLFMQQGKWCRSGRRWRIRCELLAEACADRCGLRVEPILLACVRLSAFLAFTICSLAWVSISVQFWLTPTLAYYFNRLSWIVPLANLPAVPLASAALLTGLIAALVSLVLPGTSLLYAPVCGLASLLRTATDWFSSIPGGWQRCPTPGVLWVLAALVLVGLWSLLDWRRKWIPYGVIGLLLGVLGGGRALSTGARPAVLRMAFLDVGQGDSVIIEFPDSRIWVLDAGSGPEESAPAAETGSIDLGEVVVSRYLWWRWIPRIAGAYLSHPHRDHYGGLPAVLRNFTVDEFCYAAADEQSVKKILQQHACKASLPMRGLEAGWRGHVGGVQIECLHPPRLLPHRSLNDSSLVLRLRYGRFTAMLTGDLETTGEVRLLANTQDISALLFKVPHHGSRNAAGDEFLRRVAPRWAVISAGRNNPFGNPSPESLRRLIRHGSRVLRTQDQGAVMFETDGERYLLWSHRAGILESGNLPL